MVPRGEAREVLAVGSESYGIFEAAENGVYKGLGPDLLRAIAERMGDQVSFVAYPWARAQMKVEKGQADILIGAYRSVERERRFIFTSLPFYQDSMVFYQTSNSTSWSGDYTALKSKKIAYILGWAYGSAFEKAKNKLQAMSVKDLEEGLERLTKGQIDLLGSNRRNVEKWLNRQRSQPNLKAIEPHIAVQQGYFAFPKTAHAASYQERFDEAFLEIIKNGTLEQLARKYEVEMPLQKP